METITMCYDPVPGTSKGIQLQLKDGEYVLYHSTGIQALPDEAKANPKLFEEITRHSFAMCKAYTFMQVRKMDMNCRIFEKEVLKVLSNSYTFSIPQTSQQLYPRFIRYIADAHRDGVIGDARYAMALCKAKKLQRFLIISGFSSISVKDFTSDIMLQLRQFIYDEYKYVKQFPELYPRKSGYRVPRKRLCDSTVVHDLKLLRAFFAELENSGEIRCSPFRKISQEKRRKIMHVIYDTPYFLRTKELKRVMMTEVPPELQWAKDIFILNCTIGCRISDLLRMTMDKISVSDEGIPYIHYIPSKTANMQTSHREIITPLVKPALEIIERTQLKLIDKNPHYMKQLYNKCLRHLLQLCDINRKVSLYCQKTQDNIYKPIYEVATSKLARRTHIDMLNKIQINYYAAGLHKVGSEAVFRYTSLELKDKYKLMQAAFDFYDREPAI